MPLIGLVGCGGWGKKILRDLLSLGCRVIVADPSEEAGQTALTSGAESVVRAAEELPLCLGYVIAAPVPRLATEAEKLLRREAPVFCEKPVLRTEAEAARLLAAGAAKRLFGMYKFCYHPGIEAMRGMISSGELGGLELVELERLGWDSDFQGTDCLWLVGVHHIAAADYLLGGIPPLTGATIRREQGIAVGAALSFGRDPQVRINVSSREERKSFSAMIRGARAAVKLPDAYAAALEVIHTDGRREARALSGAMPLLLELEEFVHYLEGGKRPRCSFDFVLGVSRTVNLLQGR